MEKTPSPTDFVRAMAPALRQAASIAHALEGRVANRPKAGEETAVKAALTIADTAAQEALLIALLERFPDVSLEAEEDTPSVARFPTMSDAVVVIDPIDGTLRFYLEGAGPYAVIIGLALHGEYEAGLIALPRERLFFDAIRGRGANAVQGSGAAKPAVLLEPTGDRVLVSHNLPDAAVNRLRDQGYDVCPASGGAISVAPLIPGVRAGLRVVRDKPEGVSIRGRVGALIASEAGALVHSETGLFPPGIRTPTQALLVTSTERDMAQLQEALSAI